MVNMKPNPVKEKLKSGEKIICAFMRIPDPLIAEMMAASGVELIVIDCEHFQFNVETIANVIRAAQIYGTSCLMRVSEASNGWLIANSLDMGAAGILLTDAAGVQDVKKAVDAVKYYPIGHRGVCTDSRATRFGTALSAAEHPAYFNDNTIIAVVIETKSAVEELDAILSVPEVDIISVGDADLSYAYGHPGETKHPMQIELRNEIYRKILAGHKTALDKATTPDEIRCAYNEGKRCFYITSDETLIMSGLKEIIEPIEAVCGDSKHTYIFAGGFEHDTFTSSMELVSAELNETTGKMTPMGSANDGYNYGFICRNHKGNCIYTVDTRLDRGSVVSYMAKLGGKAEFQSELKLEGAALGLHCTVSKDDRFLIAAFGTSSTVYSCALNEDGSLKEVADVFRLPKGTPTLPRQQSGPAPHQVLFDKTGRYLLIPDIHTDRFYCMGFDGETGKMTQEDCATIEGGQGPRHAAVHPNNQWVYLLTEMGTSVYFFRFDEKTGKLEQKQKVSLVPQTYIDGYAGNEIQSGGIVISPDGDHVLISMRNYLTGEGDDRIFSATVSKHSGEIQEVSSFSSGGFCPRMIDFSPDGAYLLVGNKFSNEIISFKYDAVSGGLEEICGRVSAPGNASLCTFRGSEFRC